MTMHLRAVRRIEVSEELTVSYIPSDRLKTSERTESLLSWGFRCLCHQCTLPKYLADESDHRVDIIGGLRRQLEEFQDILSEENERANYLLSKLDFDEVHAQLEYYITLLLQERIIQPLASAYFRSAMLLSRVKSSGTSNAYLKEGSPRLTIEQIFVILRYISIAVDTGLTVFGKNWSKSYNQLIALESEMQELLFQWDRLNMQ
jgi:hypothetical protein